jgi:hypothetical protein
MNLCSVATFPRQRKTTTFTAEATEDTEQEEEFKQRRNDEEKGRARGEKRNYKEAERNGHE